MRPHLGLTICYVQARQIELARIQGREILRVAPKFDMALYAKSLTYQDRKIRAAASMGSPRPLRLRL